MNQFGGLRVCGKIDGQKYVDAVLPLKTNDSYLCPETYKPCLEKRVEESFCYGDSEDPDLVCPITDF